MKSKITEGVIEDRRTMVNHLYTRGSTHREISAVLARSGKVNPDTLKPWSIATINADIKWAREEWRRSRLLSREEHCDRVLAEYLEVKVAAWGRGNLRAVLEALEGERALLGLDAPAKTAQTDAQGNDLPFRRFDVIEIYTPPPAADEGEATCELHE